MYSNHGMVRDERLWYEVWNQYVTVTVWYAVNGYGMRCETVKMRCKIKKYWIYTEKCKGRGQKWYRKRYFLFHMKPVRQTQKTKEYKNTFTLTLGLQRNFAEKFAGLT